MRSLHGTALAAIAVLLSGCVDESASVALDAGGRVLTLNVRQDVPWSDRTDIEVVASALPECQRRSRLEAVPAGRLRLEVFRAPERVYAEPILILREGGRHYALGLANCEVQRFRAVPERLGQPVGAFVFGPGSGGLAFSAAVPEQAANQSSSPLRR